MTRLAAVFFSLLTAVTASAQLFDPDDFLDPRARGARPVLISRIVAGVGSNMSGDGFRPLGENVGYVHLANSFSWGPVQFDYKRSQMKAQDGNAALWEYRYIRGNYENGAWSFQQMRYATPKSKDTLHAAWYWPVPAGGGVPVMLRSRVTYSAQTIETEIDTTFSVTVVPRTAAGRERTFALDTDTWFSIGGHDVYGKLAYSRTKTETNAFLDAGDRNESALTYTNRFPSFSASRPKILIRPTLTVGGITNRGRSVVNLVNPAIEIFRPFPHIGANLHVIYSPQWAVGENARWKTTHQAAVLFDYPLFVKVF